MEQHGSHGSCWASSGCVGSLSAGEAAPLWGGNDPRTCWDPVAYRVWDQGNPRRTSRNCTTAKINSGCSSLPRREASLISLTARFLQRCDCPLITPGLFERQIWLEKGAVWTELGCLCCPSSRARSGAAGLIFPALLKLAAGSSWLLRWARCRSYQLRAVGRWEQRGKSRGRASSHAASRPDLTSPRFTASCLCFP